MKWMLRAVLLFLVPSQLWAGESVGEAIPPQDLGTTVAKLAASVDRLAGLLEKEMAFRAEEREALRVEIAVGIMGLRYRKIDKLEEEIQDVSRQEEELARQLGLMKAELDQLGKQSQAAGGEPSKGAKVEMTFLELRIKSEEDRIANLRERSSVLQSDVAMERRQLAKVAAMVNEWMEKQ